VGCYITFWDGGSIYIFYLYYYVKIHVYRFFLKYNTIKLLHIFNKIKFIYKITQKQYEYVNKDMNFSMIYNNFIYNFIKLILYF
jgi:hypothetical protein